jgi:hypothetical protein
MDNKKRSHTNLYYTVVFYRTHRQTMKKEKISRNNGIVQHLKMRGSIPPVHHTCVHGAVLSKSPGAT